VTVEATRTALGAGVPEPERALAVAAWRFRWQVELDAQARFARLARRLAAQGAAPALVALADRASDDEGRHAVHCARLAAALGGPVSGAPGGASDLGPDVAPAGLEEPDALTYELTAACCVTESVSVAVLTALLPEARDPGLRAALHELAGDEVGHARLGWAHLAGAAARGRTAFLGRHLPAMLEGSVDEDLFGAGPAGADSPALLPLGVLPHALKRELFVRSLEEVIFPGLEGAGVDVGAGRAWLARRAG
jgi:hypothetical protein